MQVLVVEIILFRVPPQQLHCARICYRDLYPAVQLGTSHKANALLTHFNGSWSICVVLDSICWKASCGAWQRVFYHFLGDASAGFIALGLPFCFALARE